MSISAFAYGEGLSNSNVNCSIYSTGIQVVPSLTVISLAVRSFGCIASNASTFTLKASSILASSCAIRNFSRTLPDKYSSAVRYLGKYCSFSSSCNGLRNITPFKSSNNSCSVLPESEDINSISTFAFSPIDTANASLAVSTWVISFFAPIVRFVNISALRFKFPSSSNSSKEHSRK